jgi:hypothetical protein
MHKNAMKCNKTLSKWCKNKHGASKIIDTFETYQTRELPITWRVRWASSPPRSHIVVMIRLAPPMEQVCAYHMLVRPLFLHTTLKNGVFLMSFEFLLLHVVCCLFLNLLVIMMCSLNFIVSPFLSRIGTWELFCLEVAYATAYMRLMLHPHCQQVVSGVRVSSTHWHAWLGHPAAPIVCHVQHRHELLVASNKFVETIYDACQQVKSH